MDILKNLNHSYLPQVLDFIEDNGDVYTVMSYIPGKSFAQLLGEGRSFSVNELVRWGMQLCSALSYLHNQNPTIIHGDIKPGNIMLTPTGDICLIDFNISFFLEDREVLGYSNGYSSPEQYIVVSDRQTPGKIPDYACIDGKSDIYSLGATMYFMATGKKVLDYKQGIDGKYLAHVTNEAFAQIIEKATEMDPNKRFATADEMFRAFQGVTKKDQRYKNLLRRQKLELLGMGLGMALCIIVTGYGVHTMKLEKVEKYNSLVEEQKERILDGEFDNIEDLLDAEKKLIPGEVEGYYQHANALYAQGEYEECVSFIDYDILENERLSPGEFKLSEIYNLQANAYFELGNYEEAVHAFEQVVDLGQLKPEYYRDYAIALAYNGLTDKAREVLQTAIDQGLEEDSVYYVKGEIENNLNNKENALQEFQNCLNVSDDDYVRMRAYMMMSKIYESENNMEANRNILLEGKTSLPVSQQILLLERLAQADINLAESSGDESYYLEAIDVFKEIIDQNWGTYETYDNLAVLYQKLGNSEEVLNTLQQMVTLYGEDYNILKRYAFLEIAKQESLSNEQRDYASFADYYERATQMYERQQKGN